MISLKNCWNIHSCGFDFRQLKGLKTAFNVNRVLFAACTHSYKSTTINYCIIFCQCSILVWFAWLQKKPVPTKFRAAPVTMILLSKVCISSSFPSCHTVFIDLAMIVNDKDDTEKWSKTCLLKQGSLANANNK